MTKTRRLCPPVLVILPFGHLDLFRISDFGFRIFLCFLLFFGLLFTGSAWARPGVVQILNGQRYAGDIQFARGAVSVAVAGQVMQIPLTNISELKFEERPAAFGAPAQGAGNGLFALYFGGTNTAGKVIAQLDQTVSFDWGTNEPAPGISNEVFGVIWMGEVEAPATGLFTFAFEDDGGGRLFVANRPLGEAKPTGVVEVGGTIALQAGKRYPLMLFYYNHFGNARARLCWSGPNLPRSTIPPERLFAKSLIAEHPADIRPMQGLLATFYKDINFHGQSFSRIDPTVNFQWTNNQAVAPGISSSNFCVRWTGQVKADTSEPYTFYTISDGSVRLWVNGKLLLERWEPSLSSELKATLPLRGGEKYDIQFEVRKYGGPTEARLLWSTPSRPKGVVPQDHLFPSRPPVWKNPEADDDPGLRRGVLLRNGTFLAGQVEHATDTAVTIAGWLRRHPISTVNVAQINCRPLGPELAAKIEPGRKGVLLANGDFIEGEFRGMETNTVQISSVLFGVRSYDASQEAVAVVLGGTAPGPCQFELRLQDQSRLLVSDLSAEKEALLAQDPALGQVKIPVEELAELRRSAVGPSSR